ncbi:MAG: phage tail tape measure protein [Bacteroidota bacterium]
MSVRTDTVNLIVNVNGNTAQNNLTNLRKKAADIKFEMQGLVKGTAEYVAKGKELSTVTKEMDALKKQIGITSLSQKELTSELAKLRALRGSVLPFSKEYDELSKSIGQVEKRLKDVKNGTQGFSSFLGKLSDGVKQFGVVAGAYLGFQFIATQFQNIVKGASKLSDQLADLRRVTGLTAGEAGKLNQQLTDLDTRTSTEGLRNIAITAGKLGVAKDEIFEFTAAVDQLVVALGDELGDADQITTQLGKILNVFDGKVNGDNITRLGNSFVELANAGVASGAFIADFDQRLSGIAKSAGIGLGELSGLGAGLEEMGARVESSSTAVQKLIIGISEDLPKAAKIAGLSTAEFTKLFREDATEALLKYSEGLVKNKSSFAEVTASFKDAGEEGARTIETISKLGTGADALRVKIDLGKKSFQESTAITEAFRLKNETFGASIDKLGKELNKLVTNSRFSEFVKSIVQGITSLILPSKSLTDQFKEQQRVVQKLESDTLPLINRYEELKKKSTLNKDEQIELNRAITAIGNTIPGAITQFDAYGRALGINADKAREFINLQKTILKEKNRDAVKDQQDVLKVLERDAERLQRTLNKGTVSQTVGGGTGGAGTDIIRRLTDDEIRKAQETLAGYQERISGIKGIIAELKGENLKLPDPVAPGLTGGGAGDAPAGLTDEQKKAAERARKQRESEYERLKKEAAKFEEDLRKLKERAQFKGETPEQGEIDAVTAKYAELTARAKEFYLKHAIDQKAFNADEKLIAEAQAQELQNIFTKYYNKRLEDSSAKEYDESLAARNEFSERLKIAVGQEYAAGRLSKVEYEQQLRQIEKDETADRIIIAQDYSATVKKAAKDVTAFKKTQEEQTTADLLNEIEARKELTAQEKASKLQRDVLTTRPGSKSNLDARKAQLNADKELELQAARDKYAALGIMLEESNEVLLGINAEFGERQKEMDQEYIQGQIAKIGEYVGYFQQALNSLNQFINNRENNQLQKDKAANTAKKKTYKDQLDNKLLSKEQYDKKVQAADEELDKKERELRRKQAQREKALRLFQAIISVAQGVAASLAYGGPVGIAMAAVTGVLGALEIAAIANSPLPELGKGDWVRTGDKHSAPSGGINAKIERDEAVISAPAMTDKNVYTVTGTTAQITSALNSRAGGASWSPGAVIQMPKWRTDPAPTINPNLPRIMEQGGIVRPLTQSAEGTTGNDQLSGLLLRNNQLMEEMISVTRDKNEKLHAVVSIKEYEAKKLLYDQAKKASGL